MRGGSAARLEKGLRSILRTRSVRIERTRLGNGQVRKGLRPVAELEAGADSVLIRIDPHTVAPLDGFVHELIHESDWKLPEAAVVAAEELVVSHILKSTRRLSWWRKAIDSRIRPSRPVE